MAQYLDKPGLDALWTKIKGMFVAKTIKKSDSSNATQITHNGDTVSLSRGTISGTGNTSTYTASASIDIGTDDIITFTSTSRPQYRVEENTDLIPMAFLRDIPKVDSALSSTSTNPVQNKVVTSALNGKSNTGHTHSYNDLTDKPTIGNAQITIRQNGTEKGSFTLNQTSAKVIDLIDTTYDIATQSAPGLMSKDDKTKLDGIKAGANKTIVDTALNSTSTNPVQNKVIFTALNSKLDTSELNLIRGSANGLATLDSNGKVPSSQLPSYVDDVIEGYYYNSKFYKESSHKTEITGESGKIYTDLGNNKTYRWSGTTYTEISASLALGTTSSTAYPGNLGAANASNITTLQSYFTDDVANKAAADGDGNNIVDTYATRFALSSTNSDVGRNTTDIAALQRKFDEDGYAKVAVKAIADGNGDNIVNTYAKKSDLASVAQGKANLSSGNNFIGNQSITGNLDILSPSGAGKITIKGDSSHHPGGVIFQTTATSSTTANTITIPAKTGTMALTSDIKTYSNGTGLNLSGTTFSLNTNYVATKSANGLMSAADKTKLDNIEAISTDYINGLS